MNVLYILCIKGMGYLQVHVDDVKRVEMANSLQDLKNHVSGLYLGEGVHCYDSK